MSSTSAKLLQQAEDICQQRGIRFTALRRRVLELIIEAGKPLGAYELLDCLVKDGHKASPPTAYRALEFLLEQGFIHRIASHNTFIVCSHFGHSHQGLFFVCSQCGDAQELDEKNVNQTIKQTAQKQGFIVQQQNVELTGLCQTCSVEQENKSI